MPALHSIGLENFAPLALETAVLLGLVAAVAGVLGAMLGIGGGIILVPILITMFGVDTVHARSASLVAVCVTSMAGSFVYLREEATDLVSASYLQLPTAIGAIFGALVGAQLDPRAIQIMFAGLVVAVAWRMFTQKPGVEAHKPSQRSWLYAGAACIGAGIVSSLLGVGGGLIFVPVLTLLLSSTTRSAAATSTYLIGLTAAASALIYYREGQIDVGIAIPVALGILVGAQIGPFIGRLFTGVGLRRAFAVVMLINAGLLVWKVVHAI